MYGGGFATVPAYLADMFGTKMVGAIHGRLLTAWSTAGVLGPVLVNYIREYQLDHGVPRAEAYTVTMYILAGLLVLGFVCNWLVKSVAEQHYMSDEELKEEKKVADDTHQHFVADVEALAHEASHNIKVFLAWLAVWIPLGWGIWVTLQKAVILFK
jgi:MFS family permease